MDDESLRHIDTQHVANKNSSFADFIPWLEWTYLGHTLKFVTSFAAPITADLWILDDEKTQEVNDVIRKVVFALN